MTKTTSCKIIISVTNDLVRDQRVLRLCHALAQRGFSVEFTGRRTVPGIPLRPLPDWPFRSRRFPMIFKRNVWFYAEYNIRLFFHLLFSRYDILISNDLDTLPANYLVHKLKGGKLIFDSHEYFTGVPELEENPRAYAVWKWVEKKIIPQLTYCFTVNQSIADLFRKEYGTEFKVLRNIPYRYGGSAKQRSDLGLDTGKFILILQGNGINIRRGAEEAVLSMNYLDDTFQLLIIGNGDVVPVLKTMIREEGLEKKVLLLPGMPYDQLMEYTANSNLGLSLDRGDNLNYLYSLPNKIFDYIQAGMPVLCSDLPELRRVVEEYQTGMVITSREPSELARTIRDIRSDSERYEKWVENCRIAAQVLCRENEEQEILGLIESFRRSLQSRSDRKPA